MAHDKDLQRIRSLAALAELTAQRSAAVLQAKRAEEDQLTDRLAKLDTPPSMRDERQVGYAASGSAQIWQAWQIKERRRLGILTARARLAAEAARRAHARADARRRVLEKICKPE